MIAHGDAVHMSSWVKRGSNLDRRMRAHHLRGVIRSLCGLKVAGKNDERACLNVFPSSHPRLAEARA